MKWNREEYVELMTFGDVERPMFCELFGPLVGLPEEWREQGATEDEISMVGFDWDYVPIVHCGGECGPFGTPEPVVLEETDEYRIERDHLGRTTKLCKAAATVPLPLDFPVKTMDDWTKLKPYYTYSDARIDAKAVEKARAFQKEGHLVRAHIPGGWDEVRELMGEEEACLAYYTQPELMHDIMDTLRDTSVRVLERVAVDELCVHEDMAGKSGPLIGPKQITEFVAPYYQACWDVASGRGTRLFNQDSDGDMGPVIDAFLDCGVNVMHPFEPAAGMDSVAVRKKYGTRLAMLGGIDKHVLRKSKTDIDRELEYKMQPLMQKGGTAFALDHRIPNGTPLENYRYYVGRAREILGIAPLDGSQKGWARMGL
jgi:uroporphyrinogen-III decarboxylase